MRLLFALICLPWLSVASAYAADLSQHSPLSQVFAERPARIVIRGEEPPPRRTMPLPIKVPGYYGGFDTTYRDYYGTSPVTIFTRLPYACRWHGLC